MYSTSPSYSLYGLPTYFEAFMLCLNHLPIQEITFELNYLWVMGGKKLLNDVLCQAMLLFFIQLDVTFSTLVRCNNLRLAHPHE